MSLPQKGIPSQMEKLNKMLSKLSPEQQILADQMVTSLRGPEKTDSYIKRKTCYKCNEKKCNITCEFCKLVFYCSSSCKKDDQKNHKKKCLEYRNIDKEIKITDKDLEKEEMSFIKDIIDKTNKLPKKSCPLCMIAGDLTVLKGSIFCKNCLYFHMETNNI